MWCPDERQIPSTFMLKFREQSMVTLNVLFNRDVGSGQPDRIDGGFLSQASASADDDGLRFGWVQSQAVTSEPVVDCLHAKLKHCY